ncbi:MAG: carboxypeptidase-like regulatory domain-containing protein [Fidelibacterota bacterium]|nr:MAG: carboxypeptidase-like regulatory domain-containing protein [Candidatus Neomarinimicrobiota bacterium]
MKRYHFSQRCALLFVVLATSALYAGTTGKVAGTVTDRETGEPLIGANVMIDGTTLGAATDLYGNFVILNIPPGTYSVRASMIGFQTTVLQDVVVNVDLTARADFELGMEVIGIDEVNVIAERPVVVMDLTSSEARISSEQLEAMPVTEIWDVLALQSGVTKDADGGIHIRGGRSSEVAYWIDGVSVTDVYDGGLAVGIDNQAIQELQVVSGTFNAEYGQAMSGIINMVTKDGGENYSASFTGYTGDYYSTDDIYRGIDDLNFGDPGNTPKAAEIADKYPLMGQLGKKLDLQASISGPVPLLKGFATFYTTGRYYRDNGYLNALNVLDMHESLLAEWEKPKDSDVLYEEVDLDGYGVYGLWAKVVPLAWREKVTSNSKLTLQLTNRLKLRLSLLTSDEVYQDWNHERQLVPDAEPFKFNQGKDLSLGITHSISASTFYELRLSQFYKAFQEYRFADPEDPGYIDPDFYFHTFIDERLIPEFSFDTWANSFHRFNRRSITDVGKLDLTSQITRTHQLKFGIEYRQHNLTLDDYDLTDEDVTDIVFTIKIPEKSVDSFNRKTYDVSPRELSVYLQDKIEYESVIMNMGLRWDYFDPNGLVPTNPAEPYIGNPRYSLLDSLTLEEREDIDWTPYAEIYHNPDLAGASGWWTTAEPQQQISPRIGIAYPISDKGVIHFSFGHFFQIPTFNRLFDNPGYKIPEATGKHGIFPNPELKPQKTVMYELGLRQGFGTDWGIDVTGFYRDVRDWVSSGIPIPLGPQEVGSYYTYVNKDYENVRGLTINLDRRFSRNYAINLSYTFQVAEGSNSDPDDEFAAVKDSKEPVRSISPMEWDQRHTLNGTLHIRTDRWGTTLLGHFGSGYPYTPAFIRGSLQGRDVSVAFVENSRRKPITYSLDLKLFYNIPFGRVQTQLFVNVYNLFDRRNPHTVYDNTGKANRSLEELLARQTGREIELYRPNSLSDYFIRPDWYSPPRQIQIGLKVTI